MLDIIEQLLETILNLSYYRIDGTTDKKLRIKLINEFNEGKGLQGRKNIFLLTTKVGGVGVNLTGADRVIIFEPDWNPMNDSQAKERALRIG